MPEVSLAENRQYGRHRPDQLTCNLGQVVDLSMGGMRILSKRERRGNQTVVFDTPRLGKLSLTGRVTWRRELGFREHVVGLLFDDASVETCEKLQVLVKEIAQGRSQARVGGLARRHRWIGVATALVGVALVGTGRAMHGSAAWAPLYFPGNADTLAALAPILGWIGLIGGGLLVLTGLSEMMRRPDHAADAGQAQPASGSARRRSDAATQQHRLDQMHQSQRMLNCILESSLGGVGVLKAVRDDGINGSISDFEIQLVNRAAEDLLGKNEVMLLGKRLSQALPCLMNHTMFQDMAAAVRTGLPLQKEFRLDNGRWMHLALVQLGDGLAVTFADTTERHHAQARLRHVAYHDELTGLPNRKLLMEHLETAFNRAKRNPGHKFAILFLDFDRFKLVNDTLGHEVGDLLLNSISERLRENIRDVDTAAQAGQQQIPARLGGDEFVVMLDGIAGEADAVAVARRLLTAFNQPHLLDGNRVVSTASIGIVLSNDSYGNVDELIRDADTAMYEAKNSGKARFVIFDQQMHETLMARSRLEADLRDAAAREDFTLVYEPIIHLKTGEVAGFEALIRWDHAQRGVVPPAEFIPLAEELNIIAPMGEWVIKQACIQLARWRGLGMHRVFMNINLSRAQLYDGDLAGLLAEQIKTHDLDPACIGLEITETMVVNDVVEMGRKLSEIKELGVQLALDDFGTGHSSLNVLHELPLDTLKIDRTFIANAGDSVRRYGAIIATITELARNLDMQVIAEGIERPEQVALLRGLACDFAQGWLFSKPVDADEAAAIIAEGRSFSVAA